MDRTEPLPKHVTKYARGVAFLAAIPTLSLAVAILTVSDLAVLYAVLGVAVVQASLAMAIVDSMYRKMRLHKEARLIVSMPGQCCEGWCVEDIGLHRVSRQTADRVAYYVNKNYMKK